MYDTLHFLKEMYLQLLIHLQKSILFLLSKMDEFSFPSITVVFLPRLERLIIFYILYKIFQKYQLKNNRKQFLNHLCRLQNNIHFEKLYIFSQLDTQNSLINFQKYLFENLFLPNQIHFVFAD